MYLGLDLMTLFVLPNTYTTSSYLMSMSRLFLGCIPLFLVAYGFAINVERIWTQYLCSIRNYCKVNKLQFLHEILTFLCIFHLICSTAHLTIFPSSAILQGNEYISLPHECFVLLCTIKIMLSKMKAYFFEVLVGLELWENNWGCALCTS